MNERYLEKLQNRLKGGDGTHSVAKDVALEKSEQLNKIADKGAVVVINVASDFSPNIRWRDNYEYSGKVFRNILLKQYDVAISTSKILLVNFNGTKGVPISFHQEAFAETIAAKLVDDTFDFFERIFIKRDDWHDKVVEVYEEMLKVM